MTTTLVVTFPLGRYHATPWARHVNEGAVELPPSPWRLLRALYAVWRTRVPELPDDTVHAVLGKLAAPPTYFVPPHTIAHTRHYYPDTAHRAGASSTDKTLDTFAVVEPDAALAVRWATTLDENELQALSRLADALPYLGRADSICEARLDNTWLPARHDTWAPLDVAETTTDQLDTTALLTPELPLKLDTLLARPVEVRRGGLLFPAGTHLVGYQCTPTVVPVRMPDFPREAVEAVRFSVLQTVLPPDTDAIVYTDLLRQAAIAKLGHRPEGTVLGGKNGGRPLQTQHQHAHFLPVITDRCLTGIVVWAPAGLPDTELKALTSVRRLYTTYHDKWHLTIRASDIGTIHDIAPEWTTAATDWTSITPFMPSRYPKRNRDWTGFLTQEITRELEYRDHPAPDTVTLLPREWAPYRRYRPSARTRSDRRQGQANRNAAFLHLTFPRPLCGPLALGHLSHFGLGLFQPQL